MGRAFCWWLKRTHADNARRDVAVAAVGRKSTIFSEDLIACVVVDERKESCPEMIDCVRTPKFILRTDDFVHKLLCCSCSLVLLFLVHMHVQRQAVLSIEASSTALTTHDSRLVTRDSGL